MTLPSTAAFGFLMFISVQACAACFDFTKQVGEVIGPAKPLKPSPDKTVTQVSGKKSNDVVWAAVKGRVKRPMGDVFQDLLTHKVTKSGRASEMKIDEVAKNPGWIHQKASFVIKPFLFVTVEWTEDWSFKAIKSPFNHAPKIITDYEKTSGTSHIEHLCGDIELTRISPSETGVSIYEEAKATQRTEEDTLRGIRTTLANLR